MLPVPAELNALAPADFAAALEPLFERAPGFLQRLAAERPFESYEQLLSRAEALALGLTEHEQLELIDSHPRIGAAPATVSVHSFREQGYDRDPGNAELQGRLDRLNEAYERRFGFRFVIFVAGRPRSQIAETLERSLGEDRDAEKERALRDVVAIARDRASKMRAAR